MKLDGYRSIESYVSREEIQGIELRNGERGRRFTADGGDESYQDLFYLLILRGGSTMKVGKTGDNDAKLKEVRAMWERGEV